MCNFIYFEPSYDFCIYRDKNGNDFFFKPVVIIEHAGNLSSVGKSRGHYTCDVRPMDFEECYRTNYSALPKVLSRNKLFDEIVPSKRQIFDETFQSTKQLLDWTVLSNTFSKRKNLRKLMRFSLFNIIFDRVNPHAMNVSETFSSVPNRAKNVHILCEETCNYSSLFFLSC